MKHKACKAIMSKELEDALGLKLKELGGTVYYLIYRIMIETGMPSTHLLKLKVKDVRGLTTLTINKHYTRTDAPKSRDVELSDTLAEEIDEYIKYKTDEDLFLSRPGTDNTPIALTSLQKYIMDAATACNADGISLMSLKKTYIFNRLEVSKDINKLRAEFGFKSKRELFEYLGLDLNNDAHIPSIDLSKLSLCKEKLDSTLKDIERCAATGDYNLAYSSAVATYLQRLIVASEEFITTTSFNETI